MNLPLEITPGYDRPDEVAALFSEYTKMLVDTMPYFGEYLALQNYGSEEQDPGAKYALPRGRLYLACFDGALAGCIALRQLDDDRAELKRMYVRPEFRGRHIARSLAERIISDAKSIGYRCIMLDTEPCLEAAIKLYLSLGFRFTERYSDSPFDSTLYMSLELKSL